MQFISFEKWLERNQELATDDDCPECNGSRSHTCDCGDVHDCHHCGGTGKAPNLVARKIYMAECNKVRALLREAGVK